MPGAWAGLAQWRILATAFGTGLHFLAAWRAWRSDPQRPALLHYAALTPAFLPATPADAHEPRDLAEQLAAQAIGLTPGFHRLAFEDGRVLLTLCVGDAEALLREHAFRADAIVLCGDAGPAMVKGIARLCRRGTRVALANDTLGPALQAAGFQLQADGLQGVYAPAWPVKGLADDTPPPGGRCVVIGAGLSGAAAAASLARRGWQVEVLDAADAPAAGASALPAGLLAPHQSPDDNLLSQLSRAGIRIALGEARARLVAGSDWQPGGVLENRLQDGRAVPAVDGLASWTRAASEEQKRGAGLDPDAPAWWHENAAWVRPAALVRAWLADPRIAFRGGTPVTGLARDGTTWTVRGARGEVLARADLVVVAAAHASGTLLPGRITTHPVRGQVSWAPLAEGDSALSASPVNGHGHFLPRVPLAGGPAWISGSTYGRGDADPLPRAADQQANLERLEVLLPAAAQRLAPAFGAGTVQAWTGIRCASSDRRPLVGELEPGLWVTTAMGSRGLTFAALCGEMIAARLHGEPLPLALRLGKALDATRQLRA